MELFRHCSLLPGNSAGIFENTLVYNFLIFFIFVNKTKT